MSGPALSRLVDTALDRSVVLGFSSIGPAVRRRLPGWPADPQRNALAGKTVAVTGPTSGLGRATAEGLARLGARVHLVVRNTDKGHRLRDELAGSVPGAEIAVLRCDVSDLDDVRRFGREFVDAGEPLDCLVHNAGVMPPERTESAQGHELSMATHVLGPVLMTDLLRPAMNDRRARVVLVTSGGMYAQALRDDDPEYLRGDYSGTTAYARSKRAQVELLPILAERWSVGGTSVHAMHPGWADTPGVAESLPRFRKITRPVLRDADGGADTTVWLAAVDPAPESGLLWHDRRPRPTHYAGRNRTGDDARVRMWAWCQEALES